MAVMSRGRVEQLGALRAIYERPRRNVHGRLHRVAQFVRAPWDEVVGRYSVAHFGDAT
jgi:ABC-type Fe3+/spermidine/putrescine transport system ATPase subunit